MLGDHSPLQLSEDRGVAFRFLVASTFLATGLWVCLLTIHGIERGDLLYPHNLSPATVVQRMKHPIDFWAGVICYASVAGWCFIVAYGELKYALLKRSRSKPI